MTYDVLEDVIDDIIDLTDGDLDKWDKKITGGKNNGYDTRNKSRN